MDFQQYQKIFPLLPPQQQSSASMNFCPSPFRQHPQQQYGQQHQQRGMLNPDFFNPLFLSGHRNFIGGNRQQQSQQHHQRNPFQLPPTFNLSSFPSTTLFDPSSMMTEQASPPQSFTISSDGSIKEETPREIFFRTLSTSLKAANKRFSGKTTTWKNPFLYKTNLCVNYSRRSFCRFGVNCWYAHGAHELRCVPESDDLPDAAFIIQYLSFLGLPKHCLEQLIQEAYYIASHYHPASTTSPSSSSKKSTDVSSFLSTSSTSPLHSPINTANITLTDPTVNTPKRNVDKFYSSVASNGGWADIQSALNDVLDKDGSENPFGKSFHLFGNSFTPQKP